MKKIDFDSCPEFILAVAAVKAEIEEDQEKFFEIIQKIANFGPKISEDKIIKSSDQITNDQCKWFGWWSEQLNSLAQGKLYEYLCKVINDCASGQIIKELNLKSAGNWKHYKGITFV